MNDLKDQDVLILGLGISGLAMARWCTRQGARVVVADTREQPPHLPALRSECTQAAFVHGAFDEALLGQREWHLIARSPGLPPQQLERVHHHAQSTGTPLVGELDLFARALADLSKREAWPYRPKVLAITGTNGKTTVTSLTGLLMERCGWRTAVAGNIGPALLDVLTQALDHEACATAEDERRQAAEAAEAPKTDEAPVNVDQEGSVAPLEGEAADTLAEVEALLEDEGPTPIAPPPPEPPQPPHLPQVWVLELSSFQLDGVTGFEPTAATVLNITQDHLDWHGDINAYAAAKARIFGQTGLMVLNREDPEVMQMLPPPVRVKLQKPQQREHITFGADMPRRPGDFGIEIVNGMPWLVRALEADETRKRSRSEAEEELHIQRLMPADALRIRGRHNATNALAALALASAAGCPLAPMLYGLREYRGEPHRVEPVALVNGVEYFDDSKGTNVGATVAALTGLGADRRIVLILGGEGKGQDFSPLATPVARYARAVVLIGRDAPQIRSALSDTGVALIDAPDLPQAVALATQRAHAGDAVLMSPACASFDMFKDYEHRAHVFCDTVRSLAQDAGQTLEGE